MQKALHWGPTPDGNTDDYDDSGGGSQMDHNSNYENGWSREQGIKSSWNVEMLANQKRQWYQIQMKAKVKLFCHLYFKFYLVIYKVAVL